MNKVFNINLGGFPFIIDTDAYEHLEQYLKTIHRHFKSSEGYEEITSDIENRMAELFQERMETRKIVVVRDVEAAIAIMGTPEDFGAEMPDEDGFYEEELNEEDKNTSKKGFAYKRYDFGIKTGKRLFRNTEDEMVGGVASGIAAYFGIQDPVWIRLLFVLITISGGFGIPMYVILWAILPKAETASDRLAMRGEPINASNIGKIVEEELESFSKTMTELGEDISEKFGAKKKDFSTTTFNGNGITAIAKTIVAFIAKVLMTIITIIKKIGRPFILLIGFILMLAFAVSWIASVIGLFFSLPFINHILPDTPFIKTMGITNVLTVIGIPLVTLILVVLRNLFDVRINARWKAGLWSFWVLNIISLAFVGIHISREFSTGMDINTGTSTTIFTEDNLNIKLADNPYKHVLTYMGDDIQISGSQLISNQVVLNIEKTNEPVFELIRRNYSRGNSIEEASQLASNIDYKYEIDGSNLTIPKNFVLANNEKWRNQKVYLTLKVPVGKSIFIGDKVNRTIRHYDLSENSPSIWHNHNKTWTMQEDGLSCTTCEPTKNSDLSSYKDFSKLEIEGPIKVLVKQGAAYSVRLDGNRRDKEKVEFTQHNETLSIAGDKYNYYQAVTIYITMPNLESMDTETSGNIKVSGFDTSKMNLTHRGEGEFKAFVNVDSLSIKLVGRSELDLRGKGKYLMASLSENAQLDAERYDVNYADISAFEHSEAAVTVIDTIRQQSDNSSEIRVDGQPWILSDKAQEVQ